MSWTYTRRYPTWKNWPDTSTPPDAQFFQAVEDALVAAAAPDSFTVSDSSGTMFTLDRATGLNTYTTAQLVNGVGSPTTTLPVGTKLLSVDGALGVVKFGPNTLWDPTDSHHRWIIDGGYTVTDNRMGARNMLLAEVANPSQVFFRRFGPDGYGGDPTTTTATVGPNPATTVSGSQSSTSATLTVVSTAGFPSAGNLAVKDSLGWTHRVAYTSKTSGAFGGCTGAGSSRTFANGATVTGLIDIPVVSTSGYFTPTSVVGTDTTIGVSGTHYYDGYLTLIDGSGNQTDLVYQGIDGTHFLRCSGLTGSVGSGTTVDSPAANPYLRAFGGRYGAVGQAAAGTSVGHIWWFAARNNWLDNDTMALPGLRRADGPEVRGKADTGADLRSVEIQASTTEAPFLLHLQSPMVNTGGIGMELKFSTAHKGTSIPQEKFQITDLGDVTVYNGALRSYLGTCDQPTAAITASGGALPYSNTGDATVDYPLNMKYYRLVPYWDGPSPGGTQYTSSASGPATVSGSLGVSGGKTQLPIVANAVSQVTVTWRRFTGPSGYRLWCGHFVKGTGLVWDGYYSIADSANDIYTTPTLSATDAYDKIGSAPAGWTASAAGPDINDNKGHGSDNRPRSTLLSDRIRLGVTDLTNIWGVELVRSGIKLARLQDQTGNLATLQAQLADSRYTTIVRLGSTQAKAANVTGAADLPLSGLAVVNVSSTSTQPFLFYLDPTEYAASGLTTKLRVVSSLIVNDTAPGITYIVALYPVSGMTGGLNVLNATLGTAIAASKVTWTTPAANSIPAPTATADFAFPSAGWYALGVNVSGAMAANSAVTLPTVLQVRTV